MYFFKSYRKVSKYCQLPRKRKIKKNDRNNWNNMRGLEKDCKEQVVEG